jgi:perosamine synthetase
MTTGVGGMLTTNDDELALRARSVRFHGEDRVRGIQDRLGADWLMTEFQAALGLAQLQNLNEIVDKRMRIAQRYDAAFADIANIRTFALHRGARSGYYKYPVQIGPSFDKDEIAAALRKKGVAVGSAYWPPIHLQPVYRERFGYKEGDFPAAEYILQKVITLPMYPDLTEEAISDVIEAVRAEIQ